jgi:proline iminopeptidase
LIFDSYDGARLSCSTVGEGPPLVCVPGGPGRSVAYLEDLGGLSAHRTLLLLDPRATGHSEVPADPSTMRFDRLALDIEALRQHLGLDALDVLGHSAGAIVVQAWASQHPNRAAGLVLVTPSDRLQGGSREDVEAIREGFHDQPWYAEAAQAQRDLADAPPSQVSALERVVRPFSYGRWDERAQQHAAGADHQCSKRALLGFGAGVDEVDIPGLTAGLQHVTAPVLVVGGSRDGMTGVRSVELVASSFPQATTAIVEGAGHYPWVDEPAAFVEAVLSR